MPYALGIDLGTTFTAAAVVHRDGRSEMVPLTPHRPSVPTVVALDADDRWLVGETADRRARSDPDRVAREFKRRVGDPAPVLLGGRPVTTEHLLAVVLADVVATATRAQGEPPAHVVVTHPASWAEHKRSVLSAAAAMAGLDGSRLGMAAEPVAAAVHYAGTERVAVGTALAVYDLGGGTFDAAVVRRTEGGFELLGRPAGLDRTGGLDLDQAVFDHVGDALGDAVAGLDTADPSTIAALAALRAECTQAKEALSTDADTTVNVVLPGVHRTVRITRAELERRIEPLLRSTVEVLGRAIESTGLDAGRIDRILLVGGSSRVPLVGQLLASRYGRPVVVDAHPKHAIALGAAALAAQQAFGRPPVPVAAAPAAAGPPPTAAGGPGPARWLALVAALAVVAAAVAFVVTRGGDDEVAGTTSTTSTTSTTGATTTTAPEATTTTVAPPGGNPDFGFPTRPFDDPGAVAMAGLRGFFKFAGVDADLLTRVRALDPTIANAGIVAEAYDAAVTLQLAAAASGQDGSAVAGAVPDVTRRGEPCTTPADCLAVVAAGGDVDYDGATGRIELADGGERTASRWQVSEVNRTGALVDLAPVELDVAELFGSAGVPTPTTRASDGRLVLGTLAVDPRGTLVPRLDAAARLAVGDVGEAGGIGVPVEVLAPRDDIAFEEQELDAVAQLVAQGADAVLVTGVGQPALEALVEAGVLVFQVVSTPADQFVPAQDVTFDDQGLRFGFGPSLPAEGLYLAELALLDGCSDVVLVSTGADEDIGVAGTAEDARVVRTAMGLRGVGVAEEVVVGTGLDEETAEAAADELVPALGSNRCAFLVIDDNGGNALLLDELVRAGVGPHDRFLYLADPLLGVELVEQG